MVHSHDMMVIHCIMHSRMSVILADCCIAAMQFYKQPRRAAAQAPAAQVADIVTESEILRF